MRTLTLAGVLVVLTSGIVSGQGVDPELVRFTREHHAPRGVMDFRPVYSMPPLNQDTTLVCWSFSTTSYVESEMERLGRPAVRLSVMYPVYYGFVEKAKRFVASHGESRFAPGDLFTGVWNTIRKYGEVPMDVYRGQAVYQPTYDQTPMYNELSEYMARVKADSMWDEDMVIDSVKEILNRYMGAPPSSFDYDEKTYTPKSFLNDVVRLPWEDYIKVTSFTYAPFYTFTELRVPDNWGHDSTYYNVPLNIFYNSMKEALNNGFSFAIDADISEPSYRQEKGIGIIPPSDIGLDGIDQGSREFRFQNGSTTDDHLMQAIAYRNFHGDEWFLVKDSWKTAWEGNHKGYSFFHESYMKMKVLSFLVNVKAVPEIKKKLERKMPGE